VTQPSIGSLDEKINSFINSQDKHNDKITSAIEKMSEAISNLNTVHVEINHLSEKITSCESSIESVKKDQKIMNDKVISNSIQADEYKYVKKALITFMVVAVLGGGYMTKSTIDNSTKQSDAMAEIVKAIKER
jgi:prefoldin subunit 5